MIVLDATIVSSVEQEVSFVIFLFRIENNVHTNTKKINSDQFGLKKVGMGLFYGLIKNYF